MILHQLSSCWTGSLLRGQQSVTFPFSKHIPLTEMFSVQQSTELVVTPARCDNTIHDGFAFSACTFLYKKKKKNLFLAICPPKKNKPTRLPENLP